jgi:hypothetical protein
MYWRKIDEDEFYWSYLKKTFTPGIASKVKKSSKRILKTIKTKKLTDWEQRMLNPYGRGEFATAEERQGGYRPRGEHPHEGFIRAMKEYAFVALLDPTNIPEARVWSLALGVGYGTGMGVTLAKGLILGPPILALVDPQHRWAGGLDETTAYQAAEGGVGGAHPNLNKDIIMGRGSWGSMV